MNEKQDSDQTSCKRAVALINSGDWTEAHKIVQELDSAAAARIHAFLHRQEGDKDNARYWYRIAGTEPFRGSIDEEILALNDQYGDD